MDQDVDDVVSAGVKSSEMIVQREGIIYERPCGGGQLSNWIERPAVLFGAD